MCRAAFCLLLTTLAPLPALAVDDMALAQAVGASPAEGAGTPPTAARDALVALAEREIQRTR